MAGDVVGGSSSDGAGEWRVKSKSSVAVAPASRRLSGGRPVRPSGRPEAGATVSAHRFFYLRNPLGSLQDFARLGTVRRAHDAVAFHQINQVSSAAVADPQAALQQGSGRFAELYDQAYCVVVEWVFFSRPLSARRPGFTGRVFILRSMQEFLFVL